MSEEPPAKKIKRSDYRETKRKAGDDREDAAKLPQKKFYRQTGTCKSFLRSSIRVVSGVESDELRIQHRGETTANVR